MGSAEEVGEGEGLPETQEPSGQIQPPGPVAECKKTGCSGQICSDEDVITTCEFLPKYVCYQNARCERQPDGNCGWTMTEELTSCLENLDFTEKITTI